jgi:Zn-finger nucleic acid-binding protein
MNTETNGALCPRDGSPLEGRSFQGSDYRVCPGCHGVRIEAEALEAWVRTGARPALTVPTEAPEIVEGTALCSCEGQPLMDRMVQDDLVLDVCPQCHAVWFDPGELQCYLVARGHDYQTLGDAQPTPVVLWEVVKELLDYYMTPPGFRLRRLADKKFRPEDRPPFPVVIGSGGDADGDPDD